MLPDREGQAKESHQSRGFTLMEMLVTLVLFGMVSSLLWQALDSLQRLETRLSDSRIFAADEALHGEWLRQAVRSLMNGPQGDPFHFSGTTAQLSGYTAMPPWPNSGGPEPLELLLRNETTEHTLLIARRPGKETKEWPLWEWQGTGTFTYLDRKGIWHNEWPPAGGQWPALPAAVKLSGPPGGVILMAVLAGDNPMLRRAEIEAP